jgi:hypothetical protein
LTETDSEETQHYIYIRSLNKKNGRVYAKLNKPIRQNEDPKTAALVKNDTIVFSVEL